MGNWLSGSSELLNHSLALLSPSLSPIPPETALIEKAIQIVQLLLGTIISPWTGASPPPAPSPHSKQFIGMRVPKLVCQIYRRMDGDLKVTTTVSLSQTEDYGVFNISSRDSLKLNHYFPRVKVEIPELNRVSGKHWQNSVY